MGSMMGLSSRSNLVTTTVLLTLTAFSCSLPIFSRSRAPASHHNSGNSSNSNSFAGTDGKGFESKPARVSGIVDLNGGCMPGYYQVRLQGTFEGANTQVESQSDEAGHFSLVAPPGRYILTVTKDSCGSKQAIEIEDNTEHMYSVAVYDTINVDRQSAAAGGRLPASVLIEPKRAP